MKINIIGENSSNRMKLLKNLNKVTKNEDINVEINVIDDKETLSKYKDKNKPILMINEKIISNGKILTDREIRNYIKIFAQVIKIIKSHKLKNKGYR